ncbi:MAG: chain-length determining protein, partial [Mesorhizobium sp.]
SELIQRLRERQVELKTNIADLSTSLLDNHPRIRALRSQLADLDRQIRNEAEKIMRGLMTQAQTAQARENQLVADVNTLKAASARAGDQQVELDALQPVARQEPADIEESDIEEVEDRAAEAEAEPEAVAAVQATAPATGEDVEPARPTLGEVDIDKAVEKLISSGAARAIFVSPEGDEAAASAVLVAREVSDAGLRVLLLDLTASGAASRPMLDSGLFPGITNLLASE